MISAIFFVSFSLPGAELTVTCKTKNNQPGSPDIGDFGGLSNHQRLTACRYWRSVCRKWTSCYGLGFWRRVLRYVADWVNDRFQTCKFSLAFSSNVFILSWIEAGSASSFNGSAIVEHSVQRVRYCFFPPLSRRQFGVWLGPILIIWM